MIKVIHDTKYESLINWLVTIRKERGLTVRDIGSLIGEHHQLVSRIETLQRKLNIYEYIQYCEALEIDPDEGLEILKTKK
jgi:transcriptional regulator with XRE-family HTH domain